MNPSREFRESPAQKALADLIEGPVLKRALEVALMELAIHLPPASDTTQGAMNSARLEGVRSFIAILYSLSRPQAQPNKPLPLNLDH